MKNIKIVISGAAETFHCVENITDLSYEIGKTLAENDVVVLTGATTGAPFWAAMGAYKNNGFVIGISPAINEEDHIKNFNLPTDYHHLIFYTGLGFSLRNVVLIRSGDGVIFLCGRTGTLNEFTISYEEQKPMGILVGSGGEEKAMRKIIEESNKPHDKIVMDSNPRTLVEKLLKLIENK
jgi:hypothetical protein